MRKKAQSFNFLGAEILLLTTEHRKTEA